MPARPERKERPGSSMLTTGDVARFFDAHPGTIRRWCEQGIIKVHRNGTRGNRRFRREDVLVAYIERSIQKYLRYRQC